MGYEDALRVDAPDVLKPVFDITLKASVEVAPIFPAYAHLTAFYFYAWLYLQEIRPEQLIPIVWDFPIKPGFKLAIAVPDIAS